MRILIPLLLPIFVFGQLQMDIISRPAGALVTINGVEKGKTPISGSSIHPGEYTVKLEKSGYAPINYEIEITPAKSISLDFQLNRLLEVNFTTNETGLKFQLNDDYSWFGKKERFLMEEGDHFLNVFQGDSLIETRVFTIDQPTNINFEFE